MISAGDFRNGITIELEGNIYQIIEFQHVKPGKGAAFVRTKLKNIKSGGVVEKTFRPTEKCPQARIDRKDYQYLYADGDLFYFMDVETYDQIALSKDDIGDALKFVKENEMVKMCSHNGSVFAVEPPLFVELRITETEPGFKGDTATGDGTDTDGDNTPSNTLTASCTVTVFKKSSSSSSSGGGGGSSVTKYGATISDSKNGAVTASAAKAETGDKVILTPKADEGYALDKITAKDKDGKEVKLKAEKDGTYSFTMPKGGVTVDTTFKQAEGAANTDKPAAATKTILLQIGSTAVIVDDQAIINDVAPVIRNDRTLVPIRAITEALGGQVAWNEAAKEVTLTVNGKEIKMTIGKALEKYGVAPVIIGGRTFVPVRFVADELGAVTTWDDATKTVTIQAVK